METSYEQLLQMRIGEIKDLEMAKKVLNGTMGNIIERQKETVASSIEQEKLEKKDWAKNFLKEMNIDEC